MDIFDPGNSLKYKEKMAIARKTNAERDAVDGQAEGVAPSDQTDAATLRDAISAIVAGIETTDWGCVCEGLDILQRVELRVRERAAGSRGG